MPKVLHLVRAGARKALRKAGLELRRLPPPPSEPPALAEPPPLYDDPLEALYLVTQHRQPAAFRCPVAAIVDLQGFGFAPDAWHPFIAAARMLAAGGEAAAEGLLERYYDVFRPRSAAEAIIGFREAPEAFARMAPHLFHFSPWEAGSAEMFHQKMTFWIEHDYREHGRKDLSMAADGHSMFGPVTPDRTKLELWRLARLRRALEQTGFDRARGDCRYLLIRRGRDFRCIPYGGGYHRSAVMAALGAGWVPAQFHQERAVVDIADVAYWPQVRRGLWSRRQALAYVDYLFGYSSADWARRHAAALGSASAAGAGD